MLKTIVAIENDGFNTRTLTMTFEVPSDDFDIVAACKKAATDYCKTEEGKRVYSGNCDNFNWGDFETYVPDSFCERCGFKRNSSDIPETIVDFDEQIVDESDIFPDEEEI